MNPLSIEIKDPAVETRSINGQKGPFNIYLQVGWAFTGDQYPEKCVVQINSVTDGYPAGHYHLDVQQSVEIGSFGALTLKRQVKLIPVKK